MVEDIRPSWLHWMCAHMYRVEMAILADNMHTYVRLCTSSTQVCLQGITGFFTTPHPDGNSRSSCGPCTWLHWQTTLNLADIQTTGIEMGGYTHPPKRCFSNSIVLFPFTNLIFALTYVTLRAASYQNNDLTAGMCG